MRRAARELHRMGVKNGPDMPLSDKDSVEVSKAAMCNELERLHGNDFQMWIRVLKLAKRRIKKEPHHTAIVQLLAELEEKVKNV